MSDDEQPEYRRRLDGAGQEAEVPALPVPEYRRRLDGAGQEAEVPALPVPEPNSKRIERPLPVVAPSVFLRVRLGHPVCGRSARGGRSVCARPYRVSRL